MTILSLDLGTTTGFAVLGGGITSVSSVTFQRRYGLKRTPDEHIGISYLRFQKWLREQIASVKPDTILYEEPMGNLKSAAARNILVGFRGLLLGTSAYYGIGLKGYPQKQIKKWATGNGNAEKVAMLAAARKRYSPIKVSNHNEADALLVLGLYLDEIKTLFAA